ncbi:EscU/YscU/HrcU family type III secretion system export apparatus switch protein [Pantoea sp. RIT413]|uniref:EscU/YscU/HrcU family type III secretion system export apparatus switch protein n=1 Tax=Pantoea sp. RIT413 TaxID=2202162 RepID=UPI000D33317C|nr:EscU/YscU/HrcU family type III secretion system export apparatus switch protein [Pantoea sp. RIT 413]RAU29955.1 EscU/YscU/HrcU family type III secretion system export apparatus switch protein [Pantoea sp. RIT 413]
MSTSKTEKPTPKKIRDAAKKGQIFRAKDLLTSCLLLVGVEILLRGFSLKPLRDVLGAIVSRHYTLNAESYLWGVVVAGLKILLPFLLLCLACCVITGLMQSGMKMATKALKIDFTAVNPVKGLKKIFSLRTVKEFVKALLYLSAFFIAAWLFWSMNKSLLFSLTHAEPVNIFTLWGTLLHSFVILMVAAIIVIVLLDAVCEFFLWQKELKMDKKEVERENKELNGNPEIKSRRKEIHREILSDETRTNIKKSNVVIVNPTHIAICIYVNKAITPIPFISEMEKGAKALAIRRYARKHNVPVVEDIPLARALFRSHKKHTFINAQQLAAVMDILLWLEGIDARWQAIAAAENSNPPEESAPHNSAPPSG